MAPTERLAGSPERDLQVAAAPVAGSERDQQAPVKREIGILLTGVGKRYDIVSAFAQHATAIAADPNPLAPAQYAADHRV